MKLSIEFTNGLPSIHHESPLRECEVKYFTPLELKIIGGSKLSQANSVRNYLEHIRYAFGCFSNSADEILATSKWTIRDVPFMKPITKKGETHFGLGTQNDENAKYNIVVYDIAAGIITEKMFLTRNGLSSYAERQHTHMSSESSSEGAKFKDAYGNIYNEEVISNQSDGSSMINVVGVIGLVEKYIKGYRLKWNSINKRLQLLTVDGQHITYLGIRESDVYTVFKLLSLIMEKGPHNALFYIRVDEYTTPVLKALLTLIRITYKDRALVFLHHCDFLKQDSIYREQIELPNLYQSKGKSKNKKK